MARTWLSVTVELLGGRGEELWPRPGRVLAVGPSHTFADLADAINAAFARWDVAHLSVFTLSDGRIVCDPETGEELGGSAAGPVRIAVDIDTARVSKCVSLGEELQFTFDLGDDWTHRCLVGDVKIDPVEELGIRPTNPLPHWGWGVIPDQYGRRWADDYDEADPPKPQSVPDPMVRGTWPNRSHALDLRELHAAVAGRHADRIVDALTGAEIDDALQQVATAMFVLLDEQHEQAESLALSVVNRLSFRDWTGDAVAAADLLTRLRKTTSLGRAVPVDLDMLGSLGGYDDDATGRGFLDLLTGEAYDEALTDPAVVGEDAVIDIDAEPDRWLRVDVSGARIVWRDLSDFAQRKPDGGHQAELLRALEGQGAFKRFRRTIDNLDLVGPWQTFATDRQFGRLRAYLAEQGVRVCPA